MRFKFTKGFVATLLTAAALVVPDHRNADSWMTAVGLIVAAGSAGVTKPQQPTLRR